MKLTDNLFRVIIFLAVASIVVFDALLYNFCEKQRVEIDSVREKVDVEAEFNSGKFKYEQDQIRYLTQDLQAAQEELKTTESALAQQNDELLQESQKRQQLEDVDNNLQSSLEAVKKQEHVTEMEMKGWQKDYVSVLAVQGKKIDGSQDRLNTLQQDLAALDISGLKSELDTLKAQVQQLGQSGTPATQESNFTSDKNYEAPSQTNSL